MPSITGAGPSERFLFGPVLHTSDEVAKKYREGPGHAPPEKDYPSVNVCFPSLRPAWVCAGLLKTLGQK